MRIPPPPGRGPILSVAFRGTIHPVTPHRTAVEYHILQRVGVAKRGPESPSTDPVFLVHPPLSGLNCYTGNVTHEQPIVIPNDRETIHIYERDRHRASAHGCFGSGNPSDGGVLWKSLHREQWPICLRRKTTRESIKNGGSIFCVGVESSYLT